MKEKRKAECGTYFVNACRKPSKFFQNSATRAAWTKAGVEHGTDFVNEVFWLNSPISSFRYPVSL